MFKQKKIVKLVVIAMLVGSVPLVQAANVLTPLAVKGGADKVATKERGNSPPVTAVVASLLDKARHWKQQNRIDLAAPVWERVLLSNPRDEESLSELAVYHASIGQFSSARDYLKRLQQVNDKHPAIDRVERMFSYKKDALAWKQLALAEQSLGRGDLTAAKDGYLAALKIFSEFPEALLGLAKVLLLQNKYAEALELIDRYEAQKQQTPQSASLRSQIFMKKGAEAEAAHNIDSAYGFYAKARTLQPADPWASLALARMLRKQGKLDAARREIDQMTGGARDVDSRYAGALYYAEGNQWSQVKLLLDQIAPGDRREQIRVLHERAGVFVRTEQAKRLHSEHFDAEAITALTVAEKESAGKIDLVSIVASAWMDVGQPQRAIALLERSKPVPASLQLLYAGALLQAGQDEKLGQLLNAIDSKGINADNDKQALEKIRIAHSLRMAESLRLAGKYTEGMEVLKPMLAKYPKNLALLLAHARLLGAANAFQDALKDVDAVLVIEPGNHEAIRQGADYAVQLNDFPLADRYLSASKKDDAEWAALYLEAGHYAEAGRNEAKAELYFALGGQATPKQNRINTSISPNRQSSNKVSPHNSYLEAGYASRYKKGMGGLGYLYEQEIPLALHVPLEDNQSAMVFKVTEVKLDAGDAGPNLDLFGTNLPAAPLAVPYPVSASGTAFSVGYQSVALAADIGVSPVGFKFNNIVGALRWNKDIAGSNIALEGSRRSVAQSVLSYAGAVDNVTGAAWGGVSKTGVQASIYRPFTEAWSGYASAGYYGYSGTNVANNDSNHLSVSLIYLLAHTDDFEASVSARLAHSSFRQNQNFFFWGQGGYYSPQRDNSFNIPLHLTGKTERLVYEFNLSGGISDVVQAPALIYPTDPVRQAALGLAGTQPGSVNSGQKLMGLDWTVEYEFAPQFWLGNRSHYEKSPAYQQTGVMFYLRYDFDKKVGSRRLPPYPIKPYYITTQGGAGLN